MPSVREFGRWLLKGPSALGSEGFFHPQGEAANGAAPSNTPVPAAAVELTRVPIQAQPAPVSVAGIGAGPQAVERHLLASGLIVGENEAGKEGNTAK